MLPDAVFLGDVRESSWLRTAHWQSQTECNAVANLCETTQNVSPVFGARLCCTNVVLYIGMLLIAWSVLYGEDR